MSQVPFGICTYCERQTELPCLQEVWDNNSRPLKVRICQACKDDLQEYVDILNKAAADLTSKLSARKGRNKA